MEIIYIDSNYLCVESNNLVPRSTFTYVLIAISTVPSEKYHIFMINTELQNTTEDLLA